MTLYDAFAHHAPGVGGVRTEAADALVLDSDEAIVEMGCDMGANLPYLTGRIGPEGSVVIADFSPDALDAARERTRKLPQIHLVRGNTTRPPVVRDPDISSAIVLVTFVSGMFDGPTAVISLQADLIGPDGRLCLVDLTETTNSHWRPLDPVFRVFVHVTVPPEPRTMRASPTKLLNRRLATAHRVLGSRCWVIHEATYALGFARARTGVVE